MEGLRVGSFVLVQPIARGGMGTVWRAEHRSGAAAAVKIISTDTEAGLDAVASLQAEIRAVGALDHPNIVRVFDAGTLEEVHEQTSGGQLRAGSPWLAMELAEGAAHDLQGQLDWSRFLDLLLQILDALAHAHARGIIHRDLKPGNLLYTNDPRFRVLLADFGLAWRWRGSEVVHGGSLPYAAPEQILGLPTEQGPWTDLYGLGCSAFRLVTGQRPYKGNDAETLRRGHLFAPVPKPLVRFKVPDGFEGWLAGLMAKDPRERFQCAADAAYALVGLPVVPIVAAADDEDEVETVTTNLEATRGGTATLPVMQWVRYEQGTGSAVASGVRAPMPRDWARPREGGRSALAGRGLGLFGLRDVPLVGRNAERDRLWGLLRDLSGPNIAVIRGSAGVGKTHLAEWLVERANEVGSAEVFRGRFERSPPGLDGLPGLIEEHLHTHGIDAAELLRLLRHRMMAEPAAERDATHLTRLLRPADAALDGMGPLSGPDRFAMVWSVIARRAEGRRVVVFLDDAQHSMESVAFIEYVLALRDPPPVLFVLTVRDELPAFRERMRIVLDSVGGDDVFLEPLAEAELALLVRRLLPVEGDFAERVAVNANGSPLMAVQLVAALVERGALRGDLGGIRLESFELLPDSLGNLWSEALDRLVELPMARDALRVAAVLGRSVSVAEWREVVAHMLEPLPPGLPAKLANRGFLVPERAVGRYGFAHPLLREQLVLEARGDGPRADLACAEVLARRGPAFAARAGAHFEEAGAFGEAATAYISAVRWLSEWDRERAVDVAGRWYAALGRVAGAADARWSAGMQVLVDLYAMHGGEAHRRAVEELLERGRGVQDRAAEVRALIELSRIDLRALAIDRAEARAELAVNLGRGSSLQGLAKLGRAEVRRIRGDLRGAEESLRPLLGSRRVDQAVVLSLAQVLSATGRANEALVLLSREGPNALPPVARARLLHGRGLALLAADRPDEALKAFDEADRMRQRAGFDWPLLDLDRTVAVLMRGDVGGAREGFVSLCARIDPTTDARHAGVLFAALATCAAREHDHEALVGWVGRLVGLPPRGHRRLTTVLAQDVLLSLLNRSPLAAGTDPIGPLTDWLARGEAPLDARGWTE